MAKFNVSFTEDLPLATYFGTAIVLDGGFVKSVNEKTGDVVLTAEDVGARPSTWNPPVDDELSEESENPVQNKVITTQFNAALDGVSQGMEQMEQAIMVLYTTVSTALAVPASVDMSGFESGRIVETFADGTTKTTTIEFDTNGNPTKITDGDGRVTTYVW